MDRTVANGKREPERYRTLRIIASFRVAMVMPWVEDMVRAPLPAAAGPRTMKRARQVPRAMSADDPDVGQLLQDLAMTADPAERCQILCDLTMRVWVYDLALALSYATDGIAIARKHGLELPEARCRLNAGRMLRLLGRYSEAESMLLPLRERFLAAGDREMAGLTVRTLSAIYLDIGLLEQALDFNREALAIFEEVGNHRRYCMALMECAEVLKKRRQFDEALAALDNARMRLTKIANDHADDMDWLQLKYTRTLLLSDAGRYPESITAAEETLEAAAVVRCRDMETGCFGVLTLAFAQLRRFVEMEGWLARFLANVDSGSDPYNRIVGWLKCGRALFLAGQHDRALAFVDRAFAIGDNVGLTGLVAECHAALAEILERTLEAHPPFPHAALHVQQDVEADPKLFPAPRCRVVVVVTLPGSTAGRLPALDQHAVVLLPRDPVDARRLPSGIAHVPFAGPEVELAERGRGAGRRHGACISGHEGNEREGSKDFGRHVILHAQPAHDVRARGRWSRMAWRWGSRIRTCRGQSVTGTPSGARRRRGRRTSPSAGRCPCRSSRWR